MALRPSEIGATVVDSALTIPAALTFRGDYKNLTLPVVIVAGDGDRIVFKRRSEQLHDRDKSVMAGQRQATCLCRLRLDHEKFQAILRQ